MHLRILQISRNLDFDFSWPLTLFSKDRLRSDGTKRCTSVDLTRDTIGRLITVRVGVNYTKCKFYTAKKVLQQFGNRGRSPRFPNSVLPPRRYKTVLNHVSLVYLEFFVPSSFLDGRKNR